jgi:hypothetical protein
MTMTMTMTMTAPLVPALVVLMRRAVAAVVRVGPARVMRMTTSSSRRRTRGRQLLALMRVATAAAVERRWLRREAKAIVLLRLGLVGCLGACSLEHGSDPK